MEYESCISNCLDIREFRINLKKVIISFETFFRNNREYTNDNQSVEILNSELLT